MNIRAGRVWLGEEPIVGEERFIRPSPPTEHQNKYVVIREHYFKDNQSCDVERYEVETEDGQTFWVGTDWLGADAPES